MWFFRKSRGGKKKNTTNSTARNVIVIKLDRKALKKWKTPDVVEFLVLQRYTKEEFTVLKNYVESFRMTGIDLQKLEPSLIEPHIQQVPKRSREKFYACLLHVQKIKKFDLAWNTVFCKLFRISPDHIEIITSFADILSNREKFYEKYFSFYVDYFEMKEIEFQAKELDYDKRNKKLVNNLKKKIKVRKAKLMKKYEKLTKEKYIDVNFVGLCGARLNTSKTGRWAIPCKIVITEIYDEKQQVKKRLRDFISPLITKLPKYKSSTRFGLFHTALTVGPFYLEWRNHEVVVPKKSFGSKNAIISHDVPTLYNISQVDIRKMVNKIVDVAYRWNTQCFYAQSKDANKGNCQDFVDDVLEILGVDSKFLFKGMLGSFIKGLRKNGRAVLEFTPSEEFRKATGTDFKRATFVTHRELDKYIIMCLDTCIELKDRFPSEFLLLKSFDRAFWLKFLRNPTDERFFPCAITKNNPVGCPLKDPRSTMSYLPF